MPLLPPWAPNLHPLTIHFPIVLVLVAWAVDAAALFAKRGERLAVASTWLYVGGALSAVVAAYTGWAGARTVFIPGMAHGLIDDHRKWALVTTALLVGFVVLRLAFNAWISRARAGRLVLVGLGLVLAVLIQQTAERGARLVYEQGVGVISSD